MVGSLNQQDEVNFHFFDSITSEDLNGIHIGSILKDYTGLCDANMWLALNKLAADAGDDNNQSAQQVYKFLSMICSFRMSPDDPADTWHPRWQDDKQRMFTPSDINKELNLNLEKVIDDINHPALKARIADVVWSNDRTRYKSGMKAIESYCTTISIQLNIIKNDGSDNYTLLFELVNLLQRALYINGSMGKKKPMPDYLFDIFNQFYELAFQKRIYVVFQRIAELAAGYKLKTWFEVAQNAESLVEGGGLSDYPEARKKVWAIAAKGYEYSKDIDGKRRCLESYSNETLRMREHVSTYAAKAAFTRQAITELQIAGGFQERIEGLRLVLRDFQLASLSEMSSISIPYDLSEEYDSTYDAFSMFSLPDSLLNFAMFSSSPTMEYLKKSAMEDCAPGFSSLFPGALHLDSEGKPIARTSSLLNQNSSEEEWLKANSLNTMDIHRHRIVESGIKPARYAAMCRYSIEQRHFGPIVELSYFVPYGHEHLFSLGFARLWQGDFGSASYILIPQLEHTLRHVLYCSGRDSFKMQAGELQEDRSLSGLLLNKRSDLIAIFGIDMTNEIDLLFNYKAGPSLRHKVAHGKLTAGDCYSKECVYACWFIYRLICLPILNCWESQVSPQIELTL